MAEVYSISPKRRSIFGFNFNLSTKLIFLNIILSCIGFVLLRTSPEFFSKYVALTPFLILSGNSIWTFLTSMFVHANFFHLFANMFSLFFIGNFLERIIGKTRFFWVYIVSGLIGGVFFVLASLIFGGVDIPAVGASGAIFGLLGVLAILVPWSRVYLIVGPLILLILDSVLEKIFPASATIWSTIITILIFFMIFAMISFNPRLRRFAIPLQLPMWLLPIIAIIPLLIIGYFVPLPIGNSAHIGGLIIGLIYGFYLRKKFPQKTERIRNLFK